MTLSLEVRDCANGFWQYRIHCDERLFWSPMSGFSAWHYQTPRRQTREACIARGKEQIQELLATQNEWEPVEP